MPKYIVTIRKAEAFYIDIPVEAEYSSDAAKIALEKAKSVTEWNKDYERSYLDVETRFNLDEEPDYAKPISN